ncbi:MAG: 5-oxoprolinase subunit PxpB [Acidobacteria bacterium]|nr:5-oxoprolinase subunit PxpB [Acidobacteriota bacterium]
MNDEIRIFPLGDNALTVEFGNNISRELNSRAVSLSNYFFIDPFPGFVEAVPAYASTSIFFDTLVVRGAFPEHSTAFAAVEAMARSVLESAELSTANTSRLVEIPARFGGDYGPDLALLAERTGLTEDEVVELFTIRAYYVYMLGFLPGFSYMGEVDERIAAPRRDSPRTLVPRGSIGIAGRQTGIYSLDSPGGWQLIGRTDVSMFDPAADEPTYLRTGDDVRFVAI